MVITNLGELPGNEVIEVLGLVEGSAMVKRGFSKVHDGGMRSISEKSMDDTYETVQRAREDALSVMRAVASAYRAHAVIGVRQEFTELATGMCLIAYTGTAVRVAGSGAGLTTAAGIGAGSARPN